MREIKFRQFYDGGVHYWGYENISESKNPVFTGPVLGQRKFIESQQYTGLKDADGVEIYEGDLLNIYFTSSDGEHIHDCIYKASIGALGDIQFEFIKLLWIDGGKNQYPSASTICQHYGSLDYEYKGQDVALKVPDSYQENRFYGTRWKGNDKSFYFKVIGNIYQNQELLK